jgi:hypothetical protein
VDGGVDGDVDVTLNGAVLKGPFVLGSTITVSPLDEVASPTGQTFLTQTTNDRGEFSVSFSASGLVDLSGEGFYYNEVTGALSGASLTLRALYVVEEAGAQQAYVNLVTHLTALRVKHLVVGGASFTDARAQAETELRQALAVAPPSFDPAAPGISMNILGGDSPANAYLLAVSAVLAQAGGSDAGIQELVNLIASDLEEDGALGSSNGDQVTAGLLALDAAAVIANLGARLDEIGSSGAVPDLGSVLDQDRDGLTNDDDNCIKVANPGQDNADGDTNGDACDDCPGTACADGQQCLPTPAQLPPGEGVCIVRCTDAPCESPNQCITLQNTPLLSACVAPCDPLASDCGPGEKCVAPFVCVPAVWDPPAQEGEPCVEYVEGEPVYQCDIGLACSGFTATCRPFCDLDAPACITGTCQSEPNFGGSHVGVCR